MGLAHTHEENDAMAVVRMRTRWLLSKAERRLNSKGTKLALTKMVAAPKRNPDEVGDEAFAEAALELGYITSTELKTYRLPVPPTKKDRS